jgi:hypothetical protein
VALEHNGLVERALNKQRGGFKLGQQVAAVVTQQHPNGVLTLGQLHGGRVDVTHVHALFVRIEDHAHLRFKLAVVHLRTPLHV